MGTDTTLIQSFSQGRFSPFVMLSCNAVPKLHHNNNTTNNNNKKKKNNNNRQQQQQQDNIGNHSALIYF
eukprot:1359214-Amphidinium_carterae.1